MLRDERALSTVKAYEGLKGSEMIVHTILLWCYSEESAILDVAKVLGSENAIGIARNL